MPIDNDSLFKSVQFRYRNERDPDFVLAIEYHQTEDFGPTITIHNLETGPLSLPFSAFADTVEAVRGEGGGGAARAPVTPVRPSGSGSGRLMPTRTANAAVQPARPKPIQPKRPLPPAPPQYQQPEYEPEPEPEYAEGFQQNTIYAEQHTLLQSPGVAESFHAPQQQQRPKPRPQQQPPRPPREAPPPMDLGGDEPFAEDELPPEMSLRNGRAIREKAAEAGAGIKRIKKLPPKPGEKGYNEWVAQQHAQQQGDYE